MTFRRGFLSNIPAMLHRHSQPTTLAISSPDCLAWMNWSDATFFTFSRRPAAIENAPRKFSASTVRLSTAWRRDLKSNLDCKPQQREISHTWKQCHSWPNGLLETCRAFIVGGSEIAVARTETLNGMSVALNSCT